MSENKVYPSKGNLNMENELKMMINQWIRGTVLSDKTICKRLEMRFYYELSEFVEFDHQRIGFDPFRISAAKKEDLASKCTFLVIKANRLGNHVCCTGIFGRII